MKKKVLFIDTVHSVLEQRLTQNGFQCIDATNKSRQECMENLSEITGIVVRSRFPIDAEFLSAGKNLKFIARSGAGMENIDLNYTQKHHIQCFSAPEGNRNAVGEHALALLLALLNNIVRGDKEIRNGVWDRAGNRGIELDGKTVGIIGYGNNGTAFAKKLSGFDVKVLAYDKYKKNYGNQYAREATMEEIFQEADVFSFHIPQTEETIFMADKSFFNSFKKPIFLLNVARGKIVEIAALLEAIKEGKVLGAGLDVLEFENPSFEKTKVENTVFQKLISSEKVVLSPHVGGWTKESYYQLSNVLATKILAMFSTPPPPLV